MKLVFLKEQGYTLKSLWAQLHLWGVLFHSSLPFFVPPVNSSNENQKYPFTVDSLGNVAAVFSKQVWRKIALVQVVCISWTGQLILSGSIATRMKYFNASFCKETEICVLTLLNKALSCICFGLWCPFYCRCSSTGIIHLNYNCLTRCFHSISTRPTSWGNRCACKTFYWNQH